MTGHGESPYSCRVILDQQIYKVKLSYMTPNTVLITGASGFVGAHILKETLEQGYNAVVLARGSKAPYIKNSPASAKYGDRLRVIEVDDIFKQKLNKEVFRGVDALIHVATPFPGSVPTEEIISITVSGTLNIIEQAEEAGIKNIIFTSTLATIRNPEGNYKNDAWNPITKEQALASNDFMTIYSASKKYAELAIWEWAEKHPHVEITVINPPLIAGPYHHDFYPGPENPTDQPPSNKLILGFILPNGTFSPHQIYVDVRDVAKAHVNAIRINILSTKSTSVIGRKRVLFPSPHEMEYRKVLEMIKEKRPELKERLNKGEYPKNVTLKRLPCDSERIEEVLGMKVEDFHTLEKTFFDLFDNYLECEEKWKLEGIEIPTSLRVY
ncbi:hypothetical protein D9758_005635 [Tetrapyrgos nigripes]|uniref:NAD-dependent epimerase/dehydratase domain-containing protein n=1 Tax=Tetrapyrgos nigripes TaxID=182062 RepID=A0A8H5LPG8_9AGAR|nr:hypothetical protein D9758_005635 [Tetrapyrgos nigripes]